MVNGGTAPTSLICANGHEWVRNVGVVLFWGGSSKPGWLRVPADLVRTLLADRTAQPTPMTYMLAAGVGLVLGVTSDFVLGWPWWAVAAGFVVFVWLLFLSSAFRDPDLGQRLLRVLNPERANERDRHRLEDALRSGSLVGHEVENWHGARSIGGWSGSPEPDSVTIRHGEYEDAEWVEVTTHGGDLADSDRSRIQEDLGRRLIETLFPLPDDPTIDDFHQRQLAIQQAEPPGWQSISFRVDDEVIDGQIARVGSHWAALVATSKVLVEMTGNAVNPDNIDLVRIASLSHYAQPGT